MNDKLSKEAIRAEKSAHEPTQRMIGADVQTMQANKVNRLAVSDLFSSAADIAGLSDSTPLSMEESLKGSEAEMPHPKETSSAISNTENRESGGSQTARAPPSPRLSQTPASMKHPNQDISVEIAASATNTEEKSLLPTSDTKNGEATPSQTPKKKNPSLKKDRSKLRKGKWTVSDLFWRRIGMFRQSHSDLLFVQCVPTFRLRKKSSHPESFIILARDFWRSLKVQLFAPTLHKS